MRDGDQKRIEELQQRLAEGINLPDSELLEAVANIELVTNAEYAAFQLMVLIAPVIGFRSDLTNRVLPKLLYPLMLSGFYSAPQVITWIASHLNEPNPFEGMRETGLNWIKWLMTQPEMIQHVLDQLGSENKEQAVREIREYFRPFCQIPIDRIRFYERWDDDILSAKLKGVLFIQVSILDEEDEQIQGRKQRETLEKFKSLTVAIDKYDKDTKLSFSVLNWEGYYDLLRVFERRNAHELFLDEEPSEVQIVWIFNGSGYRIVRQDLKNYSLIEDYTRDLLKLTYHGTDISELE